MSAIATIAQTPIDNTNTQFGVFGTISLSGNYGAANSHGDVLDLSQLGVPSNQVPNLVTVVEAPPAGTAPNGRYIFVFCPGTNQTNGKLFIWDTGANAELTQGNPYPAGLTGGVIAFFALFPSLI